VSEAGEGQDKGAINSATAPLIIAGGHVLLPLPNRIVGTLKLNGDERVSFELAEDGFVCKIVRARTKPGEEHR
jgi:hypothetical protein